MDFLGVLRTILGPASPAPHQGGPLQGKTSEGPTPAWVLHWHLSLSWEPGWAVRQGTGLTQPAAAQGPSRRQSLVDKRKVCQGTAGKAAENTFVIRQPVIDEIHPLPNQTASFKLQDIKQSHLPVLQFRRCEGGITNLLHGVMAGTER